MSETVSYFYVSVAAHQIVWADPTVKWICYFYVSVAARQIVWADPTVKWICYFYVNVAARQIVWADPSLRHALLVAAMFSVDETNKPHYAADSIHYICQLFVFRNVCRLYSALRLPQVRIV